jgi:hypothetical protein
MVNFVPTIEGPALKRSGFRYIRSARGGATWLSPFIFSVTQAYVLEWSNGKLRFYTNGGRIESGPTSPYEVVAVHRGRSAGGVDPAELRPAVPGARQLSAGLAAAHRRRPPSAMAR